ncbi:hypothetical protein FN846DRAFT_1025710 [Sphaerosporella brunnea]|uniref:Uncharacterized protein n=1 Tax=Sphaerosporella brunnea TaxID=1250544 RepID=A0A5J5EFD3_9PEZI|nr:hypothetical protein FN846DRAFT_1025710 [Sphaerosporella brunnea]
MERRSLGCAARIAVFRLLHDYTIDFTLDSPFWAPIARFDYLSTAMIDINLVSPLLARISISCRISTRISALGSTWSNLDCSTGPAGFRRWLPELVEDQPKHSAHDKHPHPALLHRRMLALPPKTRLLAGSDRTQDVALGDAPSAATIGTKVVQKVTLVRFVTPEVNREGVAFIVRPEQRLSTAHSRVGSSFITSPACNLTVSGLLNRLAYRFKKNRGFRERTRVSVPCPIHYSRCLQSHSIWTSGSPGVQVQEEKRLSRAHSGVGSTEDFESALGCRFLVPYITAPACNLTVSGLLDRLAYRFQKKRGFRERTRVSVPSPLHLLRAISQYLDFWIAWRTNSRRKEAFESALGVGSLSHTLQPLPASSQCLDFWIAWRTGSRTEPFKNAESDAASAVRQSSMPRST